MKKMNMIDQKLAEFNGLRFKYDPFYTMADDHREYLRYFQMRRDMTYLKNELGLFGQDLTIPVYNPKTYTMEYV